MKEGTLQERAGDFSTQAEREAYLKGVLEAKSLDVSFVRCLENLELLEELLLVEYERELDLKIEEEDHIKGLSMVLDAKVHYTVWLEKV